MLCTIDLSTVDINVSAGITLPTIGFQNGSQMGTVGFTAGASVLLNTHGSIIFEPGIRFKNMRWHFEDKWEFQYDDYFQSEKYEQTRNFNYLDFFSKVKFNPLQNVETNVKVFPFIGLGVGIFMSGKEDFYYEEIYKTPWGSDEYKYADKHDFKDDASSIIWGISMGVDLLIHDRLTIGFEYNRALNSLMKDMTWRSSTIMLNVGQLF
jgi:hypothetical protein